MTTTKSAAVYKRRGFLIIDPMSKTTAGVGIATPPFEVLSSGVSLTVLGSVVIRALEAARSGLPHPSPGEWPAIAKPLYKAAGVKSWPAFVKGALYCSVVKSDEFIIIEPSYNKGVRGGFQPIRGQSSLTLPIETSGEEIGLAVLKALAISERSC